MGYLTVSGYSKYEVRILSSRFVGLCFFIDNADALKIELSSIKRKFPEASHYCWAYRLNAKTIIEGGTDNGEPSGTAGKPMLNALRSACLLNSAVVVIRYFGGTKLGKQGLIEAYGGVAKFAIELAGTNEVHEMINILIAVEFDQIAIAEATLRKHNCELTYNSTNVGVEITARIKKSNGQPFLNALNELVQVSNGRIKVTSTY